jgi:DNA replication protein DnaC
MTMEQTINQLRALRLQGMIAAIESQLSRPASQELSFDHRLASIVQQEVDSRESRRFERSMKLAKLKYNACPEDIDYAPAREMDRRQIDSLLGCEWLRRSQHVIITGATGTGKSWLGCALIVQAIRLGLTGAYRRFPRLLEELDVSRDDGSLLALRAKLARPKVMLIDDFGSGTLSSRRRQDILEMVDDRAGTGSFVVTTQLPVANWHDYIGDGTIADAILDRIIHNSHRITLKGESLRKRTKI